MELSKYEIARVKEAKFYIEADLKWLNMQLNDERAVDFQQWVDRLDFGVPKNLSKDIETYQAEMKPYFDGLITLRDKLQAELQGIDDTILKTQVEVTEEVKRYLAREEVKEPEEVIIKK